LHTDEKRGEAKSGGHDLPQALREAIADSEPDPAANQNRHYIDKCPAHTPAWPG